MFGFGYALVPLYEVFCRVTGFGGKTDIVQEAAAPITKALSVKVGEIQDAVFYVKNYSNRPITGMATFNVTPPRAGFYFKKTECFCFTA